MKIQIRKASETDLPDIDAIYNLAIVSHFTADLSPYSIEKRKEWFDEHSSKEYPVFVAEVNNKVIGWISVSAYRKGRSALNNTVEISYYLDNNSRGKGIGSQLLEHAIAFASSMNYKTIIAIVLENNSASMRLLEKNNFTKWGLLPDVAEFPDCVTGHLYYGKKLS